MTNKVAVFMILLMNSIHYDVILQCLILKVEQDPLRTGYTIRCILNEKERGLIVI